MMEPHGISIADNLTDRHGGIPLASPVYFDATGYILVVCATLAAVGNSLIVVLVLRKKNLRIHSVTHSLVANLACAHLLTCLICVPVEAASIFNTYSWLGEDVSCKIIKSLHMVLTSATILTLSAIAVDRYYSVVYPFQRKITIFKGRIIIFYIWLHSVVICLPTVFVYRITDTRSRAHVCLDVWNHASQGKIYVICYALLTVFIPLFLTCLAYCIVWRTFRKSHRRVHVLNDIVRPTNPTYTLNSSKTEIKLLKMLFIMVFGFVLFQAPAVALQFLRYFGAVHTYSETLNLTAAWLSSVECVFDPFVYGYLNKHFRQGLFELLLHCPCHCAKKISRDFTLTTVERYPYIPGSDFQCRNEVRGQDNCTMDPPLLLNQGYYQRGREEENRAPNSTFISVAVIHNTLSMAPEVQNSRTEQHSHQSQLVARPLPFQADQLAAKDNRPALGYQHRKRPGHLPPLENLHVSLDVNSGYNTVNTKTPNTHSSPERPHRLSEFKGHSRVRGQTGKRDRFLKRLAAKKKAFKSLQLQDR